MSCSLTDNSALDVYRMFVVVVGQRRLVCRASGRVLAISHVGPISHFSRFGYCKVTWTSWHYSFKRFKRLLKTFFVRVLRSRRIVTNFKAAPHKFSYLLTNCFSVLYQNMQRPLDAHLKFSLPVDESLAPTSTAPWPPTSDLMGLRQLQFLFSATKELLHSVVLF